MVSIKSFLTTSVVLIATFVNVEAAVSPTYPSPGTIQTEGQSYDITWAFDGKNPTTTYKIDFMTGSNDAQVLLANVATGVSASALKYTYTAPPVSPNSAIYFFMFTGSDGVSSWTTRFGITTPGGTLSKEPNAVEPNGDKIPWGTGKLLGGFGTAGGAAAGNTTTASTTAPVVASSPVVVAAANASSSPAVAATPATASAATTPVVAAAGNSPVPTVAQVAPTASTNAGSMVKPALGLISAVVAGYFAL